MSKGFVRNAHNGDRVDSRMGELENMCFDGEMALADGDQVIGRALLEAVASVPEGNDLVDPAIHRAKELLGQKTQCMV